MAPRASFSSTATVLKRSLGHTSISFQTAKLVRQVSQTRSAFFAAVQFFANRIHLLASDSPASAPREVYLLHARGSDGEEEEAIDLNQTKLMALLIPGAKLNLYLG